MNLLQRIERRRERELRQAQKFIEKHGVGNLPGKRSETGESSGRQQAGGDGDYWSSGLGEAEEGDLPRRHRNTISYDSFGGLGEYEDWLLDNGKGYTPLVGSNQPQPTLLQLEKRSRMNHVFSFLLPQHVELLYWRHVEGMTLQEIADQEHVSRQAIHSRLKVAEREFRTQFAAHWNDDVTWEV